ncbi:MAG: 50S ribosomal protein L29 [Candidatus Aenigmatarchaeota archaeon]
MAILRLKEIRAMPKEETDKKLAELRLELGKTRGSAAVGAAVQNPGRTREIRKTIARILTVRSLAGGTKTQKTVQTEKKTGKGGEK